MTEIVVGVLALIGTLCGAYFSNRKSGALIAYRLAQLEERVNKHNNLIERTYRLEEKSNATDHRIKDLEEALKGGN